MGLSNGEGFIKGWGVYQRVRGLSVAKLLITKDKDGIFVEYTVVAMVHMIYTKG